MEFDSCENSYNEHSYYSRSKKKETFYDSMKEMYRAHGYEIPNVIFWNVESRQNVFHAFSDYKGVQLASGQSPSVFMSIMKNIGLTPTEAMVNVLNSPVYDCITV
jgi:hypothetical protein